MENFKTVADGEIFSAAYEVNKSKFFSHVMHVETEEAAREFVLSIRKKFFDATHNCSAWVLGERGDKQKSNDDGEPGGTAGNPILDAIKKNELTNCAVVVTRYFGGIKLGAGGLIRAYSHTAALGLAAAVHVRMTAFRKISLTLEYNFLASVENFLRNKKIRVASTDYADVVTLEILLLPAQVENFFAELNDLTAANFLHEELGEILIPIEVPR
ncbi:MAG: YigZ family protein [Selenomonadaceae bacterium]|nr:YigZ family protein [Selenomonadaceae bacterium]MBQ3726019.1 YigZ family protein [Selenomonadaceae bacterium]MBQ9497009.1 YigZ family protein [Selenomonadaceae bacterium]